jgi:hypothetical protein
MTGSVISVIISNEGPVSSVLSRVRSIDSFLFALILHSSNRHRATESLRQSCQSANRMGSPGCACSKNSGIHKSLDMKIDRRIREVKWVDPTLPAGLVPFNIANINGRCDGLAREHPVEPMFPRMAALPAAISGSGRFSGHNPAPFLRQVIAFLKVNRQPAETVLRKTARSCRVS